MMKVLLCGGGNAIHVLASYIGSLDGYEVSILSLYPGEANRFKDAMTNSDDDSKAGSGGIQCENDLPNCGIVYGKKPMMISDKAADVAPGSDVVILAIPSFTHGLYLKELRFYLHKGVILGAMPGQSGFDLCVRHHLGRDFVDCCSIFATETLPWACRIIEYGKSVQVLGTKKEIGIVIAPPTAASGDLPTSESVLKILQTLIGPKPVLKPSSNFLSLTLTNPNTVHPTISYGFYRNFEDLSVPFDEVPIFYQGVDYPTGQMLCKVSDEVLSIRDEIVRLYPTLNLSCMLHIETILLRYYSDDIEDKTNLSTMLQTSRAHRGLVHPMKEITTPEGAIKYLPNFQNRYFTEDLPCGMIVIRGIAELVGVETPVLDEVITWCQNKMDKEFLVGGKLCGKDIHQTRCPEAYGFTDLDTFLKANHYLDKPSATSSTEEEEQKVMNDGTLSVKHGFVQGRVVESRRSGSDVA